MEKRFGKTHPIGYGGTVLHFESGRSVDFESSFWEMGCDSDLGMG
jgi:hypothetical protein